MSLTTCFPRKLGCPLNSGCTVVLVEEIGVLALQLGCVRIRMDAVWLV